MTDYRDTDLQLRALDRGGAVFNARAYNTPRDGVSSAVAGLTATITAAAAVGGEVYVPHGRYYIDTALDIPANVSFRGAGTGTVFVIAPGIASGIWMTCVGLVGTYRTGIRLADFHVERTGAGGIRFQYARYCQVNNITCTGTGGGILSIRDIDKCQFDNVLGWSLGSVGGAAIFTLRVTDCQFSNISGEGGQECIDLFETHRCQFTNIFGKNCGDECMDMGCSTYNTITNIFGYNCTNNILSVKVEDAGTSGGCFRNTFIGVYGHTFGTYGLSITNGQATPTGSEVCDYNSFDNVWLYTATASAIGVRYSQSTTGAGNPALKGNRLTNFNIFTPGSAITTSNESNDLVISNGYIECSGSGVNPVEIIGTSDSLINDRITVQNVRVKASSITSGLYCFSFGRCRALKVVNCEVVATSGNGILLQRVRDAEVRGCQIGDVSFHGITISVPNDATWDEEQKVVITDNRIRDCGLAGGTRYGLQLTQNSASTGEAVYVDNNFFYTTSGTATFTGIGANGTGAWDYCTYTGNKFRKLNAALTGTFPGANGTTANNLDNSARA